MNELANKDTEEAQRKVFMILKAMLEGAVSFLDRVALAHNLRYQMGVAYDDQDFNILREVVKRTDNLPLTWQRHHWSQDELIRVEPEIKRCEDWAKLYAAEACLNITRRLDGRHNYFPQCQPALHV